MFTEFDPKDPDDIAYLTWDFSKWLDTGESISSYSFVDWPAGVTQLSDSNDSNSVTVKAGGGTDLIDYDLTCRIVTDSGQQKDITFTLPVRTQ